MDPTQLARRDVIDLVGADFRALRVAAIGGARIEHKVLRSASFQGARLRGVQFHHCDLSGAVFDGADLEGAMFIAVTAAAASFRGSRWRDGHAIHADLSRADLSHADLRRWHLRLGSVDDARLEFADLRRAQITYSSCRSASFVGARMFALNAVGSMFEGARFEHAENFFMTREVIAEILRLHADGDLEKQKLVALARDQRAWCYLEWQRILDDVPALRDLAISIFAQFPDSGFERALRTGASDGTEPPDDAVPPPHI